MPIQVAIVEDNADICEGLRYTINRDPGFTCLCTCRNAETALVRIPATRPDIVVMDLELPGMSGIDCIARLRQSLPATPILVFTFHEEADRIFRAIEAGAAGYILKNTPPERILSALRELRVGGAPMSGEVGRKLFERIRQDQPPAPPETDALSQRETEVMELLAAGRSAKEIAARLFISPETVNVHIRHIYKKLKAESRVDAVLKFLRHA